MIRSPWLRLRRLLLVLLAIATGGVVWLWAQPRGQQPQPRTTWSEPQLEVILSPGESTAQNLSFTSSLAVQNILIEAVPEFARFVSIEPNSFANVAVGQPQSVTLSFLIPPGTTLGTYDGTVHVRLGNRTVPQTLKILLNVWQSVAEKGLVLHYPPAWQRHPRLVEPHHPISLNTFGSTYAQGGVIPKGGAEISITATSLDSELATVITRDSLGATIESTSSTIVAGAAATKVVYLVPFAPSLSYSNVIVYIDRGGTLFKFSLLYHQGDLRSENFLRDFQQVLDTLQFER